VFRHNEGFTGVKELGVASTKLLAQVIWEITVVDIAVCSSLFSSQ
jgi:hypothetical protein